jgi:hypothetical protein
MTINIPRSVSTDSNGFKFLVEAYNRTKDVDFSTIIFDFKNCTWFEANLCAVLGAIAHEITQNINNIEFINMNGSIKSIFSKNTFLSHFGGDIVEDVYNTTIRYKRYQANEQTLFKRYLDEELLAKDAFPNMSVHLKKKINQSIFEIFENAITHGSSDYVFSCGQHYPQHNPPRIDFTIVDMGRSIKKNVNAYLKAILDGKKAIEWAVEANNTTKQGNTPGGLGLKLIREFSNLNKGKVHIVSAEGFWQQTDKNTILAQNFINSFPGTIVNIEVNLNDDDYYYSKEEAELNEHDIF